MLKSSIDDEKNNVSEGSKKTNKVYQKGKQEEGEGNTKNVVQSLKMYFLFSNGSRPMT